MSIGWIKMHRSLAKHAIASDPHSLSVWVHLMLLANFAPSKKLVNGRMMEIAAGQMITSRKTISERTGVQESKVERILKMLESEQQIKQQGMSKFRLISIVNWETYQGDEQQSEQQMNSRRTASEQQMNTLEEGKNPKEKIKSPLADEAFDLFWKLYPNKTAKEKARKSWEKIGAELHPEIMAALGKQAASHAWTKDDGQFVPHPTTWLNGKRWQDEIKGAPSGANSRHSGFSERDYTSGLTDNGDGTYAI